MDALGLPPCTQGVEAWGSVDRFARDACSAVQVGLPAVYIAYLCSGWKQTRPPTDGHRQAGSGSVSLLPGANPGFLVYVSSPGELAVETQSGTRGQVLCGDPEGMVAHLGAQQVHFFPTKSVNGQEISWKTLGPGKIDHFQGLSYRDANPIEEKGE